VGKYKCSGICLKVHEKDGHRVLAACDEELLGQVFFQRASELSLFVNPDFYGKKADLETFAKELELCDIANLVGKEVVGHAIKAKLASKKQVKMVAKVPHIQIMRLAV